MEIHGGKTMLTFLDSTKDYKPVSYTHLDVAGLAMGWMSKGD